MPLIDPRSVSPPTREPDINWPGGNTVAPDTLRYTDTAPVQPQENVEDDIVLDRMGRTLDRLELNIDQDNAAIAERLDLLQDTLQSHIVRYEATRSKSFAERLGLSGSQFYSFLIAIGSAVGVAVDATTPGGLIG